MEERIKVDIKNGVADVKLVRADKLNALDYAMMDALIETAENLNKDKSVRCVVMSGEGRGFCAGLDMANFSAMASGERKKSTRNLTERTHGITNKPQQCIWGWRELRAPVIAAVHGPALGGGFQLMLASDIRIVHPQAKMSIMESKWGLVPDMSSTPIMRYLAREDVIRELTYTARVFSGEEAKTYGFATHVSETPHEDAMKLATEIASRSPDAVQKSKALYNALPDRTTEEALIAEAAAQEELIGSPNQVEAVMAGMEKREGNFTDG